MRKLRILVLIAMAIALPGNCLSERLPLEDLASPLVVTPLAEAPTGAHRIARGLEFIEGWELSSKNSLFDGYSALAALPSGGLLAGSDRGRLLEFRPESAAGREAKFSQLSEVSRVEKHAHDLEALHKDEASGKLWLAYERTNLIVRLDANNKLTGWSKPPSMQGWAYNGGPEAMTRLPDGRFLVVSEAPRHWFTDIHEAILFDGDPVEGVDATSFSLSIPDGFGVVDLAMLPDRSTVMLLRKVRLGLPPEFESAILFGRITETDSGPRWLTNRLVQLGDPIPPENYEGLATRQASDGAAELWLISDNNRSVFQHTYLIKLRWTADEKTRGNPARPVQKSGGPRADRT